MQTRTCSQINRRYGHMAARMITQTEEECRRLMDTTRAADGYVDPELWGIGYAYMVAPGQAEAIYLALDFETINVRGNYGEAAIVAQALGLEHGLAGTYMLGYEMAHAIIDAFGPLAGRDVIEQYPNVDALHTAFDYLRYGNRTAYEVEMGAHLAQHRYAYLPVVVGIPSIDELAADAGDVYLRLGALSERQLLPNEANMEDIFSMLANVVWTDKGPVHQPNFADYKRSKRCAGEYVVVLSQDKFPRMLDFISPDGVRVADASRVRLGAHLAESTTVMHEGFVNFNAGTLGKSMVEGRISAGVVVGEGSDIGGGASTMGTLSGGNGIKVSIGRDCLIEAEAGVGIPLGDRVRVSVGDYIKGSSLVRVRCLLDQWNTDVQPESVVDALVDATLRPDPNSRYRIVRASLLSGICDAIFRRNDVNGELEVLPRGSTTWGSLRDELHDN